MRHNRRKGHNFDSVPQVRYNRSKFDLSHSVDTTMNVGTLYPLDFYEVLPGDTFNSTFNVATQISSSFLKPVLGNLVMDIYHFFVPYRLVYDKADRVFGNPNPSQYTSNTLGEFPSIYPTKLSNDDGRKIMIESSPGTIADYLNFPILDSEQYQLQPDEQYEDFKLPSVLPFRAFARIYNEWFRNENVVDEVYIQMGETAESEWLNTYEFDSNHYTGLLPKAPKRKDYFTSCLPGTQKGEAIQVGLTTGRIPITTSSDQIPLSLRQSQDALRVNRVGSPYANENGVLYQNTSGQVASSPTDDYSGTGYGIVPNNLWADFSNSNDLVFSNVNDLRFAFQLQKMLELDARSGSRLNEYYLAHFGVSNPDSRLQFTEFLGGGSIPIRIQAVAQTSQGTSDSPQANLSAYSNSFGFSKYSKGFTEHGYVFTIGCIRQLHSYQQGISKLWFRRERNDFYDPLFAHLGEQPVYSRELKATIENVIGKNNDIFGYNEAFADYRTIPNKITGGLRSGIRESLDIFHFGDYYSDVPVLSQRFVEETPQFVDRTLSVPSSSMPTFVVSCYNDLSAIRVMPLFGVPGLIDHS